MEETGATNPKYQPLRFLRYLFMRLCMMNHLFGTDSLVTGELVPLVYEESLTKSSLKSVTPVFWYSHINSSLPSKRFFCGSRFFFLLFSLHTFYGLHLLITHFFMDFNQFCISTPPYVCML